MPSPYSFTLAGSGVSVKAWPRPEIDPAILWVQDSAGNWNGSDRGAAQDVYTADVTFMGVESEIDTVESYLQSNREGVTLAAFTSPIFAPNVSHTGSISATVSRLARRRHRAYGAGAAKGVYELDATLRAISPNLLGTTPSLATLKLQEGFEADKSYEVGKDFTYNQTAVYSDQASDSGRFIGTFRQTVDETRAILAYLLTTARAASIAVPTLGNLTYAWGQPRGVATNCRVKSIGITRRDFVFYDLEIELVEVI
jgi:hypothetical protein